MMMTVTYAAHNTAHNNDDSTAHNNVSTAYNDYDSTT